MNALNAGFFDIYCDGKVVGKLLWHVTGNDPADGRPVHQISVDWAELYFPREDFQQPDVYRAVHAKIVEGSTSPLHMKRVLKANLGRKVVLA